METGQPLASYDLWEERYGILSWTVAATWGGLTAGAKFPMAFGDEDRAAGYTQAADAMKQGVDTHLWQPKRSCFARMINFNAEGQIEIDDVVDASL